MASVFHEELIVSNETANLACVRDFIQANLGKTALPGSEHVKVILAVDEAVSNIMRHAYEDFARGTRSIEVVFQADEEKITLTLKDSGREFDPTGVREPDISEHVKLGKKYGLGLFLMRRIMDEVKFVFRSGIENMLTMVKYIRPPESK
jgi:serine/threonine-protein kinase RsbW